MSNQKTYEWPAFDLKVKQYEIWAVEWKNNPRNIRLVLIVQGNHLNDTDPVCVIVCPLSSQFTPRCWLLRMYIYVWGIGEFTILINQVYTINAQSLVKKVGELDTDQLKKLRRNLAIILGFMI